jgi:hypothetical protein
MITSGQMISHAFEDWSNGTGYVASLFSDEMTRQIDGGTYRNTYAWFMTLNDEGKIIDGTAFYDSISFDELGETVRPAFVPVDWLTVGVTVVATAIIIPPVYLGRAML